MKLLNILTLILLLSFSVYSIPVIPGEEGFGIETVAGRGGDVYKITDLDDGGPGSLRECVEADGPRTCIFEISGEIVLTENLEITEPFLTIAGQTAPSPGITLRGASLEIKADDILVQHLRIRPGDEPGTDPDGRDAIIIASSSGQTTQNVVIDHVSLSWATDEDLSLWSDVGAIRDVTIINSIISEGLFDSIHSKGPHSMGVLIGKNTDRITFKKNILAHNNKRNPLIRDDAEDIEVINNLIYRPGPAMENRINIGSKGEDEPQLRIDVIGNVYIGEESDDGKNTILSIEDDSTENLRIYMEDNIAQANSDDVWDYADGVRNGDFKSSSRVVGFSNDIIDAGNLENYLTQNAGARYFNRDSVDDRIITQIENREGELIDSQDDVGGWPSLAQNYRELVLPENYNDDDDGDGYTNLEEWLHEFSEGNNPNADTAPPQRFNVEPTETVFPIGTTEVEVSLETDEWARCKFANTDATYGQMSSLRFTKDTQHSEVFPTEDGQRYDFYILCRDADENTNSNSIHIQFRIDDNDDNLGPQVSNMEPSGTINTLSTVLRFDTDENGECRYSEDLDPVFDEMSIIDDTSEPLKHAEGIENLVDGTQYTFAIKCKDDFNNINTNPFLLTFNVQLPSEEDNSGGSSGGGSSGGGSSGGGGGGGGGSSSYIPPRTQVEVSEITENNESELIEFECEPFYEYSPWGACTNGNQTRTGKDLNLCSEEIKVESRACNINTNNIQSNSLNSNNNINSKSNGGNGINVDFNLRNNTVYASGLDENEEFIVTGERVDKENFVIIDEKTGTKYLANLVLEEKNKNFYYYSLESIDDIFKEKIEEPIIERTSSTGLYLSAIITTILAFIVIW